jgi:hypothetical protein
MTPEREYVFQLGAHIYASVLYKHTYSRNAFLTILLNSLDISRMLHSQDTRVTCCRVNMLLVPLNIQADKK